MVYATTPTPVLFWRITLSILLLRLIMFEQVVNDNELKKRVIFEMSFKNMDDVWQNIIPYYLEDWY